MYYFNHFKYKSTGIKYTHHVMQQSPLPIFRMLSSPQTENCPEYSIRLHLSPLPLLPPGS